MLKMRGREKLLISGVNGDGSTALYLAGVDFSPGSTDVAAPICVSGSICPGCKTNCQIVAIPQHNTGLAFSVWYSGSVSLHCWDVLKSVLQMGSRGYFPGCSLGRALSPICCATRV